MEFDRAHLNQVGPDRVGITDCRKTYLFAVQHSILNAIHFGASICQIRSQPPQLIFDMLVFSEVVLAGLGQIFQRRRGCLKLLVGPFKAFLYLAAFSVAVWRSPPKFFSAVARREVNDSTCCWDEAPSRSRRSCSCYRAALA